MSESTPGLLVSHSLACHLQWWQWCAQHLLKSECLVGKIRIMSYWAIILLCNDNIFFFSLLYSAGKKLAMKWILKFIEDLRLRCFHEHTDHLMLCFFMYCMCCRTLNLWSSYGICKYISFLLAHLIEISMMCQRQANTLSTSTRKVFWFKK